MVVFVLDTVVAAYMLRRRSARVLRLRAVPLAFFRALRDSRYPVFRIVAVREFSAVGQLLRSHDVRSGYVFVLRLVLARLVVVRQQLSVFRVLAFRIELRARIQAVVAVCSHRVPVLVVLRLLNVSAERCAFVLFRFFRRGVQFVRIAFRPDLPALRIVSVLCDLPVLLCSARERQRYLRALLQGLCKEFIRFSIKKETFFQTPPF